MEIQQRISKDKLEEKIGNIYNCIVENMTEDGEYYIGRIYMDVPSEDGVVYIKYQDGIALNEYIDVIITGSSEYDLYGEVKK
jgi:ribosomal protein S12 methylthiotransferase